ncbi:MAG: dihydroorotate dehydrogenase-like protein [Deltaproteobacteria bacterium]|nr:dihydroorotate dehydrogenase-like protein [Deltaproteobacteria bacterium]
MNMATKYLGLDLEHPLVAGAGPLAYEIDSIKRLEEGGAAAIVLHSLFEEQLVHDQYALNHFLHYGRESFAESLSYFPEHEEFHLGPEEYLRHIQAAKEAVKVPVIASLNGDSIGGWTRFASLMEQAGADGIELNIYYIPTDPTRSGAEIENMYVEITREVASSVNIPVAVKIGSQFTAPVHFINRLHEAGAAGIVMFNRFYQPDIDIEELEVRPHLMLSNSSDLHVPLRWIAIAYGHVKADLAATSGVHHAADVLRYLMAGATVVQMTSCLLKYGAGHVQHLLDEVKTWMTEKEYTSVAQLRGSLSQLHCPNPEGFERANYMKTLQSYR